MEHYKNRITILQRSEEEGDGIELLGKDERAGWLAIGVSELHMSETLIRRWTYFASRT